MKKTFEVDWDSYEEVTALGNKIKCRLGELHPKRVSKKEGIRRALDSYESIYNADIGFLYDDKEFDETPKYYVYCHMRSDWKIAVGYNTQSTYAATLGMTHIPFYIGKGCAERANNINRNELHRKIKEQLENGVLVHIIKDGLTEKEAFMLEDKLIDIFGLRIFGGYLINIDEGYKPKERRIYYELNGIRRKHVGSRKKHGECDSPPPPP